MILELVIYWAFFVKKAFRWLTNMTSFSWSLHTSFIWRHVACDWIWVSIRFMSALECNSDNNCHLMRGYWLCYCKHILVTASPLLEAISIIQRVCFLEYWNTSIPWDNVMTMVWCWQCCAVTAPLSQHRSGQWSCDVHWQGDMWHHWPLHCCHYSVISEHYGNNPGTVTHHLLRIEKH